MNILRIILKILLNRYVITLIIFGVWMMFFDNNSLKRQRLLNDRIDEINRMRAYYQEEIARNQEAIHDLNTNMETLERYAREKYLMKRENEDVYLIVRN